MNRPSAHEKSFSPAYFVIMPPLCLQCHAMQCFVNEQQSSHILRYPLAINHLNCIQSVSTIDFFTTAFIGNLLQFYK